MVIKSSAKMRWREIRKTTSYYFLTTFLMTFFKSEHSFLRTIAACTREKASPTTFFILYAGVWRSVHPVMTLRKPKPSWLNARLFLVLLAFLLFFSFLSILSALLRSSPLPLRTVVQWLYSDCTNEYFLCMIYTGRSGSVLWSAVNQQSWVDKIMSSIYSPAA